MNALPDDSGEKTRSPIRIAFGPVPTRRLGSSLGMNNIPYKVRTYACVYCQMGHTLRFQTKPSRYYEVDTDVKEVAKKVAESKDLIDYLTFVPDGEPTLDANIEDIFKRLKPLGIRIAVITNGKLIEQEDVRAALRSADWISLKVDSVDEDAWRRVNRPHRRLSLSAILEGMLEVRKGYTGNLVAETMLVAGINDREQNLKDIASFLARLSPQCSYISIPTKPPVESWVSTPNGQ